jgi:hypothetical protein
VQALDKTLRSIHQGFEPQADGAESRLGPRQ